MDITLQELAAECVYTASHLSHLIRFHTGKTFQQLVRDKKLAHAGILLQNTSVPIAEIADLCGFADQSHFYKTFKAAFGMTPMKYRDLKEQ